MVDNKIYIAIMQIGDISIEDKITNIHADKIDVYFYPKETSTNELYWEYQDLIQYYHKVIPIPSLKYEQLYKSVCGSSFKKSEKRD